MIAEHSACGIKSSIHRLNRDFEGHRKMAFPGFGHALLPHFLLDPDSINLNAGSYGVIPRRVLQQKYRILESQEADVLLHC